MSETNQAGQTGLFSLLKQSLSSSHDADYTTISIRRAVLLLAFPMMLEMIMESIFALVDLYFVGHLPNSSHAIQTVGLTESVLAIIYSLAIGMSMAATAVVARRVGEKNPEAAAHAGMQAILISIAVVLLISIFGVIYAAEILSWMGASAETVSHGTTFVRITMGGSTVIMLLFLINGIFRGAGNASIAMRSLLVANVANIILCPLLINGWGPVPAFGLTGAAIATTIGRGIGVLYQVYHLFNGRNILKFKLAQILPDWEQIRNLVKIATPAIFQFVIASCSWIFLAQLIANTGGDEGSAGYQTALRLIVFFILPAWGLSNAASTLVGQNLGAGHTGRAEESVLKTTKYNVIFMIFVTLTFYLFGGWFIGFFTNDEEVKQIAIQALRVISAGYVFYGVGMVMLNAFNGAGDTWTPTWINLFGFWLFQIPLAYLLVKVFNTGLIGAFAAIPIAETLIAIAAFILFRRGKWKTVKV